MSSETRKDDMAGKSTGVAAVERALAILDAFRSDDPSLTLHDLAGRTGFYKSTLLRLLATLERRNCVVRLDDGRYRLGPALLNWGNIYQRTLRLDDHILPILTNLAKQSGESTSFFIRHRDIRLCLLRVDSSRAIRDHVRAGDLLPLNGAGGRVLIAFADEQSRQKATSMAIATFGERDRETAAVASPVLGRDGSLIGAVSASGPRTRFTAKAVSDISRLVIAAALDATNRLGGDVSSLARLSKARPLFFGTMPPATLRASRP